MLYCNHRDKKDPGSPFTSAALTVSNLQSAALWDGQTTCNGRNGTKDLKADLIDISPTKAESQIGDTKFGSCSVLSKGYRRYCNVSVCLWSNLGLAMMLMRLNWFSASYDDLLVVPWFRTNPIDRQDLVSSVHRFQIGWSLNQCLDVKTLFFSSIYLPIGYLPIKCRAVRIFNRRCP